MKNKSASISRKIIALLICVLIIVSSVLPAFAVNVSLDMRQLGSDFNNYHKILNWNQGGYAGKITVFKVDGEYAFCTQAGRMLKDINGTQWNQSDSHITANYDISNVVKDNSTQTKIAYLGFYQYQDDPEVWNNQATRDWHYAMTQMMIWQSLPESNLTANGYTDGKANSYFTNSSTADEYESFKSGIQGKINSWSTKPSFNNQTLDIKADETKTFTDSNGVLADYNSFTYTKNGITVSHTKGSNLLNVKAAESCSDGIVAIYSEDLASVGGHKYDKNIKATYMYSAGNSQDLAVYWNQGDPIDLAVAFKVKAIEHKGIIKVNKTGNRLSSTTELDEVHTPLYGKGGLMGAIFNIIAAENIKTPDGTVRAEKGQIVDTVTTDENGWAQTKELYLGTYNVVETASPLGYVKDETPKEVKLEYAGQTVAVTDKVIEVENTRQKVRVTLNKQIEEDILFGYDSEESYKDIEFSIYAGEAISAADGKVVPKGALLETISLTKDDQQYKGTFTKDLPHGKYYVKESKQPVGYIKNNTEYPVNFEYTDSSKEVIEIKLNNGEAIKNELIRGNLYGKKLTDDGNNLKGALVGLFKADTTKFTEKTALKTATSADDGTFSFKDIPYGNYIVREIKAPEGYILNEKSFPVTIDTDGDKVEVEIRNNVQKGIIYLKKTGEKLATVKENADGTYTPVFQKGGVEGAEYKITAKENVYTGDGVLRYKKGQVVDTLVTDKEGKAQSKQLFLGKYQVVETKAPYGHVINNEVYDAELKYKGQKIEFSTDKLDAQDTKQKANVTLSKSIEDDVLYGYDKNNLYKDIAFGIYADEEITAADGTILPATGLVEVFTLEKSGELFSGKVSTDLPNGKYYVKEIAQPTGYIINDTKYPVDFSYCDESKEYIDIKINDGKVIENELIRGKVSGLKLGELEDTEISLAGAVFGLFELDETNFDVQNALVTAKSGEDGRFFFENIPYGNYRVCEITSPEGYMLSSDVYQVDIEDDQEVIEITAKNKPIVKDGVMVPTSPKTGDDANIQLWILVVVTGTCLMIAANRDKKKKE